MTLQASGPISLSEIQTEFAGSNPIAISEYYGVDTPVPSSGEISMSDFYGTSAGGEVTMEATYTITSIKTVPTNAKILYNTDGSIDQNKAGITTDLGIWWSASPETGIGSDYEIRASIVSGTVSSGTTGSWLALSLQRSWNRLSGAEGVFESVTLTIEIRDVATSTVQDTTTVTLNASDDV